MSLYREYCLYNTHKINTFSGDQHVFLKSNVLYRKRAESSLVPPGSPAESTVDVKARFLKYASIGIVSAHLDHHIYPDRNPAISYNSAGKG